ncbi:MAG: demethoxyubiquinone hydroxylase family protein [Alphaproteobacteria bacterium]|nr:demethoxyubiquinone hydroxylase family protein [Alphaproteobacteria bacterium]
MDDARKMGLPGEPAGERLIDRVLRVDHAGEYGAVRIYEGQLAVLGRNGTAGQTIAHMAEQERRHLEAFEKMLPARRARPTLLQPVWHAAGFALGAATAMLGEKAAMACTVAVEEVIDAHYREQIAALPDDEAELKSTLEEFRREEVEHRDTAIAHEPHAAPGYELLTSAIKAGSRLAIWLSSRI